MRLHLTVKEANMFRYVFSAIIGTFFLLECMISRSGYVTKSYTYVLHTYSPFHVRRPHEVNVRVVH
jgi:hypothetical protein